MTTYIPGGVMVMAIVMSFIVGELLMVNTIVNMFFSGFIGILILGIMHYKSVDNTGVTNGN